MYNNYTFNHMLNFVIVIRVKFKDILCIDELFI